MAPQDDAAGGRIGFDSRLIGALGIGRYISGLLPPLAGILGSRLTLFAQARDTALIRALVGPRPSLVAMTAPPYRFAEQTSLPLKVISAGVELMHFPHYNLPLVYQPPFVVTIHDLFPFDFPEIHSGALPRMVNQMLVRNAVRRARYVIAPSKATEIAIRQRFPGRAKTVVVIPEASDEQFSPTHNRAAESAWQAQFGIRPPYVLYLGQWKAYKNLPVLLEAFRALRESHPQSQLVIAGDDPRHPEIRVAAATLPDGSVVLPGRLPESAIPDLYRGAAVLVLPSRAEGFGLPVLEAMACGVPVVCSDLPVLREIAEGIAVFCDPRDPAAFARAIGEVLSAPANPAARQRAIERAGRFSWQRAAEETVAVYEASLAGRLVSPPLEEDSGSGEQQDLQVERQ